MKIKTNFKKKENKKTQKSGQKKERAKPEETRLEEEIKEAEKEIEQDSFEEPTRTIPIQTETSAPVLERIIQRQEQVEPIQQFTNQREERRERRIDYSPASNQPDYGFERATEENEGKKYESTFVPPVLSRREIQTEGMRQEFLRPSGETGTNENRQNQLEGIDILEEETRLPFEEQKKYKRFKLR